MVFDVVLELVGGLAVFLRILTIFGLFGRTLDFATYDVEYSDDDIQYESQCDLSFGFTHNKPPHSSSLMPQQSFHHAG